MRPVMIFGLLALIGLSSACSPSQASVPSQPTASPTTAATAAGPTATGAVATATSAFPLTFTDAAGRQLTLAKQPEKIISISASNTEILYALGLEGKLVGVDQYSDYPPEVKDKPRVGSYLKPDLEKIIALEPDLILGTSVHLTSVVPELEKHNLPVMIVDSRDVKGVLDQIQLVGRALGHPQEASALSDKMRSRMEATEARLQGVEQVRVFYELSPQLHSAGPGSFVNDVLHLAKGSNVAEGAGKEWPQLNQEALFLSDPQVILLADHGSGETPEKVAARPGWQQITAVKQQRVIMVDPNVTNRPGPRVVDALDMIAKALHPDKYK